MYDFGSHLTKKKTPIHYLNKLEYFIRPIKKKTLVNCWPSGKYVNLLYMYSILGRGSFCFIYCLNSAWHGGDQFVGFFDRGLQLICIFGLLFLIFLLTIPHRFSMMLRSGEFAGQSSHHGGHLTSFWCFWQCGQVPNPAGK